ncbi:MAG: glucoamylase family protein, partial [Planctomycetota bacterium]
GLGLKRGLGEDLVIAPYASILALSIRPREVVENLRELRDLGAIGRYGLYESIDYTASRLPEGRDHAIVRSHMAHHQGMILSAIANYLLDESLPRYFHANPLIQGAEPLLDEQVNYCLQPEPLQEEVAAHGDGRIMSPAIPRVTSGRRSKWPRAERPGRVGSSPNPCSWSRSSCSFPPRSGPAEPRTTPPGSRPPAPSPPMTASSMVMTGKPSRRCSSDGGTGSTRAMARRW